MDIADAAMGQVLRAIGEALVGDPVERDIQAVFEQEVQRMAGMRLVRLREIPLRCHARLVTPTRTSQSIVLGVPTGDLRTQGILEVTFDAGNPAGRFAVRFSGGRRAAWGPRARVLPQPGVEYRALL
jgi:hypothetical protein